MMKKTLKFIADNIWNTLRKLVKLPRLGTVPGVVCLCSFIIATLVAVSNMNLGVAGYGDLGDFEAGRVAERDVTAEYTFSYVDETATRLRIEAQERLIPAVFRYSETITLEALNAWNDFCVFIDNLAAQGSSAASMLLEVQKEYPARFSADVLSAWFADPERVNFREYGLEVLNAVLVRGIFALGSADLGGFNPDKAELLLPQGDRTERERLDYADVITLGNVRETIVSVVDNENVPAGFKILAVPLISPFMRENVFFSPEDSQQRVAEARDGVSPVIRTVEKANA